MEQEGASSLVQFWLMADNFQRHLSHPHHVPDIDLDTRDAIAIYDRCIVMTTLYECMGSVCCVIIAQSCMLILSACMHAC